MGLPHDYHLIIFESLKDVTLDLISLNEKFALLITNVYNAIEKFIQPLLNESEGLTSISCPKMDLEELSDYFTDKQYNVQKHKSMTGLMREKSVF